MTRDTRIPLCLASALAVSLLVGACATVPLDPPTCPTGAQIDELARHYLARQPAPNPSTTMTAEGAACGRDKFASRLGHHAGPVIGYKAALTNAAVQKRFNATAPVRGTLFAKMLVDDGATVDAAFGSRPLFEADLVVAVRSSAIHDALTPLEALEQLTAIHPFIELPDLIVQDPTRIDARVLTALNGGTRMGVLGKPIPVDGANAALAEALRTMTVRLVDGDGRELDAGKGSGILGDPLNAVLWLAADLKRSGITLKEGDLLSLGSFTRLLPPKPGMTVRAVYEGLPGTPSVGVTFR